VKAANYLATNIEFLKSAIDADLPYVDADGLFLANGAGNLRAATGFNGGLRPVVLEACSSFLGTWGDDGKCHANVGAVLFVILFALAAMIALLIALLWQCTKPQQDHLGMPLTQEPDAYSVRTGPSP
jgi:hypothetical protein